MLAGTLVAAGLAGCSSSSSGTSVVGSFYPLAWAAERIGGNHFSVLDLTPPGVEAHDVNLNAKQVGEIETAKVVLLLGYLGFEPQVEAAARQANGRVVLLTSGLQLRPSTEKGLSADPHVWLDPVLMREMASRIGDALERADPGDRSQIQSRTDALTKQLSQLDEDYRHGLSGCRYTIFVTTHEAFGYLAQQYGLDQLGIEGLTPEAEPSAGRLQIAESTIRDGKAAPAVFYEGTSEGQRIGRSVASDLGVSALPLGTLEFDPSPDNYLTVMRDNLRNLERGLQCK